MILTIYKDFYRHLGELIAEFIWFGGSTFKSLRKKGIVRITNSQVLADMREKSDKYPCKFRKTPPYEVISKIDLYMAYKGFLTFFTK